MIEDSNIKNSINNLIDVIRDYQDCKERFKTLEVDISMGDFSILGCIGLGIDTPSGIARALGIERASVSRSLDELENRNLIKRSMSPMDRRFVLIEETTKGLNLIRRVTRKQEVA